MVAAVTEADDKAATTPPAADKQSRRGQAQEMRVSSTSNPQSLASAISHAIYDNRKVTLRAIGNGAVGQAVKAVVLARGFVAPRGFDIALVPGWVTTEGSFGDEVSAMTFRIIQLE